MREPPLPGTGTTDGAFIALTLTLSRSGGRGQSVLADC
jgi:hypothetical protein